MEPNLDAAIPFNRGAESLESKAFDAAIADFTEAIEIAARNDQDYAGAYNGRGVAYMNKGNLVRALADFDEAIRLDRNLAEPFFNKALLYFNEQSFEQSLANYNRGLTLDPSSAFGWHNRGAIWHEKGDYGKAVEDYSKAINLDSKYILAFRNRANAWYSLGRHDESVADLAKAASLSAQQEDFENAVSYQQQAFDLAEGNQKVQLVGKLKKYRQQVIQQNQQ